MDLGASGVRFKNGYFSGNLYGDGSNLTGVGGSTDLNAVGTYAFLRRTGNYLPGVTVSGGAMTFANSGRLGYTTSGTGPAGTWRQMGSSGYFNGSTSAGDTLQQTVYVRIS